MTGLDVDSLDSLARRLTVAAGGLRAEVAALQRAAAGPGWSSRVASAWLDAVSGVLTRLAARADDLDDLAGQVRAQASAAHSALAAGEHAASQLAGSIWHAVSSAW
jgi:ABC-type transporter Mla subunit MlaD